MRLITLTAVMALAAGACAGASKHASLLARPMPAKKAAAAGPLGMNQTGPTRVASATATTPREEHKEKLVVEAWIAMKAKSVPSAVDAIRSQVSSLGGRIVNESLGGAATSWNAHMRVRVPPTGVSGFIGWLGGQGDITSKRVRGTDVSRTLFDQKIALGNLTQTMQRLRKLLESPGLDIAEILKIEKELTRLRGRIETIKGARRFLADRVTMATVDIQLSRKQGAIMDPKAKFYPGARFSSLLLFDRDPGQQRTRFGGGVSIYTFPEAATGEAPRISIDLDFYENADGKGRGFIASMGSALYSDFFGRGKRRFLNPYLQFRLGYGHINESSFVAGGGAGIELFKHKRMLIDLSVNAVAFIRDDVKAGLVGTLGAVFAF